MTPYLEWLAGNRDQHGVLCFVQPHGCLSRPLRSRFESVCEEQQQGGLPFH